VIGCNALPDAGTWEEITPNASAHQGSDAVALDPFQAGVVWMSAGAAAPGGLYRSTDCGATWTLVSTGENADAVNAMGLTSMVLDPVNPGTIYATPGSNAGPGSGLLKSTNGGKDFQQLFPPSSEVASVVQYDLVSSVGMEAANPLHLVVSMHAVCAAPYGPVCEAETTDGGATWTITKVDIPGLTDWVAGAGAFILDANRWLFSTYSNGLWLTKDRGATWSNVTATGAWGSTSGKTINAPFRRSADGNFYLADETGVLQSADGEHWTLLPSSGGRTVGLASGTHRLYSSDQWSNAYHSVAFGDLGTWTTLLPPAALTADQGAPFLAFDAAHSVLYASTWAGGAWRILVDD
jgi:hypothetical protein